MVKLESAPYLNQEFFNLVAGIEELEDLQARAGASGRDLPLAASSPLPS